MAKNFAEIAFTDSVKAQQEHYGSRQQYARSEKLARGTEIGADEADFIAERDGFYLATVSETGQPYVQFRGGSPGFLKVLDAKTLGYADFRGNLQYISMGNLSRNDRAALFLMDYAHQQRLKIFAQVEVRSASADPDLIARLRDPSYAAKIERAVLLHVEAFDWNCQQHITPRYTLAEIETLNAPLHRRIEELEAELKQRKAATGA